MKLYFFSISFSFNFLICKICFSFNKLEKKNKTLISYFPDHFSWHNQTLESVFQLIFHYTTKHRKIIYFSGIHFLKGNYFSTNKQGLGPHFFITYFIWNNLWNVNYYYFNFFIFYFFYFLDLISIILIIIYFIWDNLWNYIFFQFKLLYNKQTRPK